MLSSKIILVQQRSHRALGGNALRHSKNRSHQRAYQRGFQWICVPNVNNGDDAEEERKKNGKFMMLGSSHHKKCRSSPAHNLQQQRRHLTIDRRHGWKGDSEEKPKESFAKKFLEPAARGELVGKHSSDIPKLSVRKSKGHSIQGVPDDGDVDFDRGFEDESSWGDIGSGNEHGSGDLMQTLNKELSMAKERNRQSMGGGGSGSGGGSGLAPISPDSRAASGVYTLKYDSGKSPEYWREEDYDQDILTDEDRAFVRGLVENAPVGDGSGDFDWSDFDVDAFIDFDANDDDKEEEGDVDGDEDEEEKEGREGQDLKADEKDETPDARQGNQNNPRRSRNSEAQDEAEAEQAAARKIQFDCISPLNSNGEDGEELWKDLMNHPTMYAEMRHYNVHPESKREPKPYYPKTRADPAPEFVDFYKRWMFVTGLPPAVSDEGMKHGVASELTVTQQQEIEMTVTKLLGVSSEQVFPANETSAFVGFEIPEERATVLQAGPKEKTLSRPVEISSYTPTPEDDKYSFLTDVSTDTVVQLTDLPPGRFSRDSLARDLFPEGSELGDAYPLTRDDVAFPSPTTALIRWKSAEQAKSALSSETVKARLAEIGNYPVRFFRARRNLVFHKMGGPLKNHEVRRLGDRLIVDGDMPSKNFHLSHAGTMMLRNVDHAAVSKASLTEFFQPFSKLFRDEDSSIEFVTCENGLPTGNAYVGFESLGEAEAVMAHFKGRARIGDNSVQMRLVRDRHIPGLPTRVARPERTEEEILKSLNDWEQYVDPKDIAYLEKNGVQKVVLDEALRMMRFHNRSFSSLDLAMVGEKLENEKASGDDYKELVQMYVSALKDSVATPENPGVLWELMHFPGEPIDRTSVFEAEKQRQKKLMKKRGL